MFIDIYLILRFLYLFSFFDFRVKVEEFRKVPDGEQFAKAKEIYETFLDPAAPKEVNVSAFLVKKSKTDLDSNSVGKKKEKKLLIIFIIFVVEKNEKKKKN